MAKQIMRIEGKADYVRGITCNVGRALGGSGVNVVPADRRIEVALRVPSQQFAEEMTHWFLGLEPIGHEVELTVEGGMNRPPYQKDAGIAQLFGKAQAAYREIGKELADVPLTGGGSDGDFTAALGIPTLDGPEPAARARMRRTSKYTIRRWSHAPTSARGCWKRWSKTAPSPVRCRILKRAFEFA